MSRIRADRFVNNAATGAPELTYGAEVPVGYGITGAGGINITGVVTAASFSGDGSGLTGVANTAIINSDQINVVGVVTAASFSGDGGNLTNVGAAQSTRTLQVWLFGGG
jgi:hypothetical protein